MDSIQYFILKGGKASNTINYIEYVQENGTRGIPHILTLILSNGN